MSAIPDHISSPERPALGPVPPRPQRRIVFWPLWASLAGLLGFLGTIVFDVRPPAEREAWTTGEDYTVTAADMGTLDHVASRLGWTAGLLSVVALLIFWAVWQRATIARRSSVGARLLGAGVLITAAAALFGYGWKGALGNYLGAEAGTYDDNGVFVYYMLTDFGAYMPWFGVLIGILAVVWMAFAERLVSRVLGGFSLLVALFLSSFMFATGVPGIPGTLAPLWLIVFGIWLAVGRSPVVRQVAR